MNIEKDWYTKAGLRAIVVMTEMGHRCGYVGVAKDHPLYGVEYNESSRAIKESPVNEPQGKRGIMTLLSAALTPDEDWRLDVVFDVHGSLTFSGQAKFDQDEPNKRWWFGFDAGHHMDAPDLAAIKDPQLRDIYTGFPREGTIRTLDYMAEECESLAKQLIDRCV